MGIDSRCIWGLIKQNVCNQEVSVGKGSRAGSSDSDRVMSNILSKGKCRVSSEWHFCMEQLFIFTAHILDEQKHFISSCPRELALLLLQKKPFLLLGIAAEHIIEVWVFNIIALPVCELEMRTSSWKHLLCPVLCLWPVQGSAPASLHLSLSLLLFDAWCSRDLYMMCRWRCSSNLKPH